MNKGKIVQVMGPVVDVEFENNDLPYIKDALEVDNNGKKCIMEVAQHIGNNTVRCIMLSSSEGLCRDMEVVATGSGIKVPVGDKTLGRLFNVVGETIDGGESLENENHWVIHRDPPTFEDQSPVVEVLETGIKVIDLLAPYAKGGKYLVFTSARDFNPTYSQTEWNHVYNNMGGVYLALLSKDTASPFMETDAEVAIESTPAKADASKKDETKNEASTPVVKIDIDDREIIIGHTGISQPIIIRRETYVAGFT